MSISEQLEALGFELENMGGNTTAWVRMNGTAEEWITDGDGTAPEDWTSAAQCHVRAYRDVDGPITDIATVLDYMDEHGGNIPLQIG